MRTCEILSGLPGSGKSHYSQTRMLYDGFVVVSDDQFFQRGDTWLFDPKLLGEAHKFSMRCFLNVISKDLPVIVDNTNTTAIEIAPYWAVANACSYNVKIIRFDVPFDVCMQRQTHNVPEHTMRRMHENLAKLPQEMPWWWRVLT